MQGGGREGHRLGLRFSADPPPTVGLTLEDSEIRTSKTKCPTGQARKLLLSRTGVERASRWGSLRQTASKRTQEGSEAGQP